MEDLDKAKSEINQNVANVSPIETIFDGGKNI